MYSFTKIKNNIERFFAYSKTKIGPMVGTYLALNYTDADGAEQHKYCGKIVDIKISVDGTETLEFRFDSGEALCVSALDTMNNDAFTLFSSEAAAKKFCRKRRQKRNDG